MKAAKVNIDPNMCQIKLESKSDLNKLAKKSNSTIIESPELCYDFIIKDGALYFANKKK